MSPEDRDYAIRTIIGESAGQPFLGQEAVANVILNRLNSGKYGKTIADVVFAPKQFEPWMTRRNELMGFSPASPAYQQAAKAFDAAQGQDVTGGATFFLNPDIVRQRTGGTLPSWAQGPGMRIGQHVFYGGTGAAPTPTAPAATGSTAAAQPTGQAFVPQAEPAPVSQFDNAAPLFPLTFQTVHPQIPPQAEQGAAKALLSQAFAPRAVPLQQLGALPRVV